jgi:hypothetical protein
MALEVGAAGPEACDEGHRMSDRYNDMAVAFISMLITWFALAMVGMAVIAYLFCR